ncbi:hypothetical protein Q7C_1889 [Methylophaga frappieri]|uniref:Lipoprotein n=1 Tax=Methylophaga frappieri (strain ATCC BAA-2434 / DSM 25690 / JAM7) TaxID=754477 RepID=I1YJD7_METFJ|nr:hypothetical protein [Methylophaga frappieri]AFJ03030.1 hypothetical protein Q7C_1889 [Methylophaga frappieri]
MEINTKQSLIGIFLLGAMAMTSGCGGEFSYKRGASATDFQQEKQRCEKVADSATEQDKCLQDKGWLVVGPDKPLIPLSRGESKTIAVADKALAPEAGKPVDPLEKLTVNSWWRVGAGPEKLLADSADCNASLGEGHAPEANLSIVTRGLLACMQDKGWAVLLQQN